MERCRLIDPEFFADPDIASLSPLARLLFIGLWTRADKAGRLRARPQHLRSTLLCYDDGPTADDLFGELIRGRFLIPYTVAGKDLYQVRNWLKYQRPPHRETESSLPPPPDSDSPENLPELLPNSRPTLADDCPGTFRQDSPTLADDSAKSESIPGNHRKDSPRTIPNTETRADQNPPSPQVFVSEREREREETNKQANGRAAARPQSRNDFTRDPATWNTFPELPHQVGRLDYVPIPPPIPEALEALSAARYGDDGSVWEAGPPFPGLFFQSLKTPANLAVVFPSAAAARSWLQFDVGNHRPAGAFLWDELTRAGITKPWAALCPLADGVSLAQLRRPVPDAEAWEAVFSPNSPTALFYLADFDPARKFTEKEFLSAFLGDPEAVAL